jgi:adenylylsulfate kinase
MMEHGIVIWFTGIPASGKSTLAMEIQKRLEAMDLPVENLDADEVRANLSPNLGYTEEARDENTKRLAWFANKMAGYGANVVIAAVSSLRRYRDRARDWCEKFVEVYVETPLEVCQERDPKGLYARAAKGEVNDIAGMHQPYEPPLEPEVHVQTADSTVEECADVVIAKLQELGYLPAETQATAQEAAE